MSEGVGLLEIMAGRRSIRGGFEARPVPREVVDRIVECGLAAPSSKNAQPWRIHVVDSRRLLRELATAVREAKDPERYVPIDPATGRPRAWESTVTESADVLSAVPLGLFVENRGEFSGGRQTVAAAPDGVRASALVGYGLELVGVGAAIQSMWLAALAQGLSGVFMGDVAIAEAVIRERLQLNGDLIGVLALGFSTGAPEPKLRHPDRVVWHGDAGS